MGELGEHDLKVAGQIGALTTAVQNLTISVDKMNGRLDSYIEKMDRKFEDMRAHQLFDTARIAAGAAALIIAGEQGLKWIL